MRLNRKLVSLSIWLLSAATVFVAACDNRGQTTTGSGPAAAVGATIDDSIITTKVKSGLLADPQVKGLQASVETHKGAVTLSGSAETQSQISRAVEIARAVDGVKDVENKMNIKK